MSAILSACGTYRYVLHRTVGDAVSRVVWVMLNPSTADAETDDPTIRKVIGFSRAWGFGRFSVVNLYALRSTEWRGLLDRADPVGPYNEGHLCLALESADAVVLAWGAHAAGVDRARRTVHTSRMRSLVRRVISGHNGIPLWDLGTSKDGSPRHPLMLPYATTRRDAA